MLPTRIPITAAMTKPIVDAIAVCIAPPINRSLLAHIVCPIANGLGTRYALTPLIITAICHATRMNVTAITGAAIMRIDFMTRIMRQRLLQRMRAISSRSRLPTRMQRLFGCERSLAMRPYEFRGSIPYSSQQFDLQARLLQKPNA